MVRFYIIFFIISITGSLHAQEIVFEQNIIWSSGLNDSRQSFPVVSDDELALFLFDSKDLSGLLLDDDFTLINIFSDEAKDKKFADILGYSKPKFVTGLKLNENQISCEDSVKKSC
jgi:hypothetical protein